MIDYNILATGSKGNAVVINREIMIDCGIPFRALKDVYKDLRLVLLTHIHGDHFNRMTIKKLAQERPTLRFGCPHWLAWSLIISGVAAKNIDVYEDFVGLKYGYSFGYIEPFDLIHNVPNCGYRICTKENEMLLYATDTNSMDGIEAKNYDLYMLEANYIEAEITERIRRKQEAGEYCHEWDVLKNHLSQEKADEWLYRNMGQNSQYIYMHRHEN